MCVDYPALQEQLFLAEELSTERLEARILEGAERLDFVRAQDTYHASQVGNSDSASFDNKYCPYCLKHKNNCYAKHPEKRPKDDDNTTKDYESNDRSGETFPKAIVPKGPQ